jgi:hypothetical protein
LTLNENDKYLVASDYTKKLAWINVEDKENIHNIKQDSFYSFNTGVMCFLT